MKLKHLKESTDFTDMDLGWLMCPGFTYEKRLEGYDPNKFIFGARAGPEVDISNLVHEVAHAILSSMNNKLSNLQKHSHGLTIKSGQEIMGRWYEEPMTNQASLNECRVFAIQKIILDSLGKTPPNYYDDQANLLKYMPDQWITPEGGERQLTTTAREEQHKELYANQIRRFEKQYSLPEIKQHWKRICNYILQHRKD